MNNFAQHSITNILIKHKIAKRKELFLNRAYTEILVQIGGGKNIYVLAK